MNRSVCRCQAAVLATTLCTTGLTPGPRAVAAVPAAWGVRVGQSAVLAIAGAARSGRRKRRRMSYKVVDVSDGGTIEGVILYPGALPPPRKIQIVKDQAHCGGRTTRVPAIKVGDGRQVADAVVFLADIKQGKALAAPATKPRIDQKMCTYHPHVQVIARRQPFDVVNSDPVLHNIQAVQGTREPFNFAQPRQGMVREQRFTKGGLVILQCQAHQWMRGYVYVAWHPYFQVTGADGRFKLTDVPPGDYTLAVWQETLGEQSRAVKVETGTTTKVEFALKAKDARAARTE